MTGYGEAEGELNLKIEVGLGAVDIEFIDLYPEIYFISLFVN